VPWLGAGAIEFGRDFHGEGFVGTFVVELAAPCVEGGLPIAGGGAFQLAGDVSMEPFVASVVLGTAGTAALEFDSVGHPPGAEPREAQECMATGEGGSVVAADGSGDSVFFEEPLEAGADGFGPRVAHGAQLQQVAAVLVAYGEGLAAALGIVPPAFEVDGPEVVGGFGFARAGNATALAKAADAPLFGQPAAIEHALDAALAGRPVMLAKVKLADLPRTPVEMAPLEVHEFEDDGFFEPLGRAARPPALLSHPSKPIGQEALLPLVADSWADAKVAAERPEVVGG